MTEHFPCKEETHKILGACFEVYKDKGCGFTEPVYQECLGLELAIQGIPFRAHPSLSLHYKGQLLRKTFEPDFVCLDVVVVEIKTVSTLAGEHRSQLLNYLNASGLEVGLLVNFGHYPGLEYERLINQLKRTPQGSV